MNSGTLDDIVIKKITSIDVAWRDLVSRESVRVIISPPISTCRMLRS